mmetsp:Transcript_69075/g.225199  ORF Transcript_69075/g.225199 Transcript_69075/m.225199 type:complete len:548 (-) Transcript_69075:19-1662(-)
MALQAIKVLRKAARRCVGLVLKGAPPEPEEEVVLLLKSLKLNKGHLLQIYDVFHFLKQTEDEEVIVVDATWVEPESVRRLIKDRRKWVLKLLTRLLDLGGCKEEVTWNNYLWIFLRFCSLNRVELAQALFLLIQAEVASPTVHYIDSVQLREFYNFYQACPVPAFNTQGVNFDKLPMTRFYASDFVELTQRFECLMNPLVDLQRVIQSHVPSKDFWDQAEGQLFCRKISFDFFVMGTSRLHLRGEPAFRETCDMLLPDALGAIPINLEQWVLRTSHCRGGKGLRQVSVWGEQPPPEVIDQIKQRLAEEAEQARLAREERDDAAKLAAAMVRRRFAVALQGSLVASPAYEGEEQAAEAALIEGTLPAEGTLPVQRQGPEGGSPGLPRAAWTPPDGRGTRGAAAGTTSTAVQPLGATTAPAGALRAPGADASGNAKQVTFAGVASPASGAKHGPGGKTGGNGKAGGPPPPPPEPAVVIDANALSLYAATLDEGGTGPMDELPPAWMKGATICPAPQLPGWGCVPKARTLGRTGESWGHGQHCELDESEW